MDWINIKDRFPTIEELKPCPFCGGKNLYFVQSTNSNMRVECFNCLSSGPQSNENGISDKTIREIIDRWNERK